MLRILLYAVVRQIVRSKFRLSCTRHVPDEREVRMMVCDSRQQQRSVVRRAARTASEGKESATEPESPLERILVASIAALRYARYTLQMFCVVNYFAVQY